MLTDRTGVGYVWISATARITLIKAMKVRLYNKHGTARRQSASNNSVAWE